MKELFDEAINLGRDERAAYLDKLCGDDAALRAELQRLLNAKEQAGSLMPASTAPMTSSTASGSPAVFSPGQKVADRFRIIRFLGEGGMGQVYQAEDQVLGGLVALKTIRPEIASKERNFERFKREVRLAKEVTDENVCRVFDLDHHNVPPFVTMELVDGETLSMRLRREGRMTTAAALPLVEQMAHGLDAAHHKGIIHRDFKPGNVMLTRTGSGRACVKVTDFGLARALEDETTAVPGAVAGTLGYMAPELIEGARATVASDLYALGLVMCEMVTGTKPEFKLLGPTDSAPSPRLQVPDLDPKWEAAILRCLAPDPAERFASATDVVLAIRGERPTRFQRRQWDLGAWAIAAIAVIGVLVYALGWRSNQPVPTSSYAFRQLTFNEGVNLNPALSPDGKLVAYASDQAGNGNLNIWVRQVSGGENAIRLTDDPADDDEPDYAPDGRSIVFHSQRAGGGIYLMSALGGGTHLLAARGRDPRFSPDGQKITFWVGPTPGLPYGRIGVLPTLGGDTHWLVQDFYGATLPIWAPDSRHVIFSGAKRASLEDWDWWVASVDGGPPIKTGFRRHLNEQGAGLALALPGPERWDTRFDSVVFTADESGTEHVWRVPLSSKTWRIAGVPVRLTAGTGEQQPSLAAGLIAFASIKRRVNIWSLPVDLNGVRVTGEMLRVTETDTSDYNPSISRDGRILVYESQRSLLSSNIWIRDLGRSRAWALMASPWFEYHPMISGDGKLIAYTVFEAPPKLSEKKWVGVAPTSGGAYRKLCDSRCALSWALNSTGELVVVSTDESNRSLAVRDVKTGREVALIASPNSELFQANFSPDDLWILLDALVQPDRSQIFIAPFSPNSTSEPSQWIPVTSGDAMDDKPRWSPDGNLIYFVSHRDGFACLWVQRLDKRTKQPVGAPWPLYHLHDAQRSLGEVSAQYSDISIGGGRIVMPISEIRGNLWVMEPKKSLHQ